MVDRRPGIRCRLAPGSIERQRDTPLHPRPEVSRKGRPLRQAALPAQKSDQDHVRPAERLAQGSNPLRQVRQNLPLRRRTRCNRHVPALRINESGAWNTVRPHSAVSYPPHASFAMHLTTAIAHQATRKQSPAKQPIAQPELKNAC
jgi:hypothetical protein